MARILLLATTTGYQTRAFGEVAERLGIDLVFATDRCTVLDDPWLDRAIPIRFHDEAGSVAAILEAARTRPIDGILAVGDRPTVVAALAGEALGLSGHPATAAAAARNKRVTRERMREAGLAVPWFVCLPVAADPRPLPDVVTFPCVVKPLALSGSRGVMRADDEADVVARFYRLRTLMRSPDLRNERNVAHHTALIEGFVEGREFALEGVLTRGSLHVLAIFDKPDPLEGPFFEETIYVTPSAASCELQRAMEDAVGQAARALGLSHGPVHAECRANEGGVVVLEVAARPIGGLCARALRFRRRTGRGELVPLEEVVLRHALGEQTETWTREDSASGVMMIPIPRRGTLRQALGLDEARAVRYVEDVRITAKADQLLVPLPEGASYLGFIFARAGTPQEVERALRRAHLHLQFVIDSEVRVVQSSHG